MPLVHDFINLWFILTEIIDSGTCAVCVCVLVLLMHSSIFFYIASTID